MWRRYLRFRGADARADVDEEIAFHIDLVASSLIAAGEAPEVAWRAARAEFGDLSRATKECYRIGDRRARRAERAELFAAVGQDLRYSLRSLRGTPLFTVGVIAMMALAFAATTAMFSLVDAMFIQAPHGLRDASSVHRIYETGTMPTGAFGPSSAMSFGRFADLRANAHAFSDVAAYSEREVVVATARQARMGRVVTASASLWHLFDVGPALGRVWRDDEEPPNTRAVVTVLSYDFWRDAFDADSAILGRSIALGGRDYRVIGVAPRGFSAFSRPPVDAFIPLTTQPGDIAGLTEARPAMRYASAWLNVVVRQRSNWSDDAARRDLEGAEASSARAERSVADSVLLAMLDGTTRRAMLVPLLRERGPLRTDQGRVVLWLGGFSLFVLVVAALNVANLLRARLRRRQREIAIRLALGATLARLLRLLFVESGLLTSIAAIAGVGLIALLGEGMSAVLLPGADLPRMGVGVRPVVFTCGLTLIVSSVTAFVAALQARRWAIPSAIAESAHTGGGGRRRVGRLGLAVQGALALSLCTTAGLFLKSLHNVRALPLGYDPTGVVVVAPTSIADIAARARLFDTLVAALRQRFGEQNVARSFGLPFSTIAKRVVRPIDGDTVFARRENIFYNAVSASYFEVVHTRIVEGRAFTPIDDSSGARVAIVSRTLARGLWPGREAVGQCLVLDRGGDECTRVVGVSEDTRVWSLRGDAMLQIYGPLREWRTGSSAGILVRTPSTGVKARALVQGAIGGMAPSGVVLRVSMMGDGLDRASGAWRIGASMLSVFAVLTLIVAALGVYATTSFDIAERERDLGVRIALGATRWALVRGTLSIGARIAFAAAVAGIALSVAISAVISASLFNVAGRDIAVYAAAIVIVFAAFFAASVYPALRSWDIDPVLILRSG